MNSDIKKICKEFAKRGFVAITVEYRLGVKLPSLADVDEFYTVQQVLGMWRAAQDARGAIRSIIRRENEGTEPFRIDTSKIFLAGNSAGAVTAMNVAYYNLSSMLSAAFPSGINSSNVLGGINQNFYYGQWTGTNAINYTIAGVLDMWGGVLIPKNTTASDFFFQSGNTIPPTIAFCGALDKTFVPTTKRLKFLEGVANAAFRNESFCLQDSTGSTTFTVSEDSTTYGKIVGSQNIYNMLHSNNVLTEFYLDCDMKHGIQNPSTDNFGLTTATTDDAVNLYIVQRAATFFQAIMGGKTLTDFTTTKFVECLNYRNTCDTADNNDSCPTDANSQSQVCK